jgi:hypothetical protein
MTQRRTYHERGRDDEADDRRKALRINLGAGRCGTFAEIGLPAAESRAEL